MVSHSQLKLTSQPIGRAEEIFYSLRPETQVVGIDEVQFFGPEIVPVVEALAGRGLRVICAGLDQDYQGRFKSGESFAMRSRVARSCRALTGSFFWSASFASVSNSSQR